MRRRTALRLSLTVLVAPAFGLLVHGCSGSEEPLTSPQFVRKKPPPQLTITGAGPGGGRVTVPPVLETPNLSCQINAGTWGPEYCERVFPYRSVVTLTATPDEGSTFAGWSGACTGKSPTCNVLMTQARTVRASFGGSSTPGFTLNVVGKGDGSGRVKSQPGLTPAIDCTIRMGTRSGKACSATYVAGTSVTLSATPVGGHAFTAWNTDCSGEGPCTVVMSADRAATAELAAPAGALATVGKWSAPVSTPIVVIHVNTFPNGKWLLFGHEGEPQLWSPGGTGFTQVSNPYCTRPTCLVFCAGHAFLPDGRLLTAGGHNDELGDGHGVTQASIFDGTTWAGTGAMAYRRWYPTLVELENGDVVAMSGSEDPNTWAHIPERYNGSNWTPLSSASLVGLPLYPRAFLEPKAGRIFYAGEGASQYLDPSGTGQWTTSGLGRGGDRIDMARNYGAAVMLDSKVLYVGGGGGGGPIDPCPGSVPQRSAEVIDLSAATPTWTATGSMSFARRQLNLTVLPDGKVLSTGGTSSCGFSPETEAVFASELYDPVAGTWTAVASQSVVRVYHSTTALMPDGRVFSSGSGEGGGTTEQRSYQIFSPPYLYKGSRPPYNLPSSAMRYGQPFTVRSRDAAKITKVTIVGLTTTTHGANMGQRLNTLSFKVAGGGKSLTVTPPASGRIAPPGPYMLFILNGNGVPSIARTILLSQ